MPEVGFIRQGISRYQPLPTTNVTITNHFCQLYRQSRTASAHSASRPPGRTGNRAFLPFLSDLAPGRTGNRAFLPILSDLGAGECVCQNGCAANDKTKTQQANTKAISLCAKWTGGVRQSDTPFILSRTRNRLLKILAYFGPAQKLQ